MLISEQRQNKARKQTRKRFIADCAEKQQRLRQTRGFKMSQRTDDLNKFLKDIRTVLEQEWSDRTRKELEDRIILIERSLYALSEDNRKVRQSIEKDIKDSYRADGTRLWR